MSFRSQMRYMNPYDIHKVLINDYILKRPGDTKKLLARDTSKDKRDSDIIKENHKFLWDENDPTDTWEAQFAKKYYNKLFREYCIADLSLYKENKIAMRWRTENEVVTGKGQFICANKKCKAEDDMKTWEVNFGYTEHGTKKNALVKIRLCPECSRKLNYHHKKKEVKRLKSKKKGKKKSKECEEGSEGGSKEESVEVDAEGEKVEESSESPWESGKVVESKSRDEEMEDYLQDLLL